MGKKVKTGKARKDKFYQLAKESGYRSRAAFKLLQLNRTYHFLEKSRVCIDLCAAPGGWLQVAATNMPLSSIIIGVDLAPIRHIANVITHVEDITTEKCRATLKKDLADNKADLVLHDGAPNVGKNWIHDAYQQNMLVLQSFKLAAAFLKKGGNFVTKVFRSKDYYSLIWVLQQFFKRVEATKPQASRHESAEIFVVCQNYTAPERIDPKFFDIKFVFSDVENQHEKKVTDLFRNEMEHRHRSGYPDNDFTLYHKLKASDFIMKENFVELLANSNEIELDDERIGSHAETTPEIKECLKDVKLLGKVDIKNLLKWRLKLREDLKSRDSKEAKDDVNVEKEEKKSEEKVVEKKESIAGEETLEGEIENALLAEQKVEKKKKKKVLKEKRKLKEKIALKMELPNDQIDFNLQGDNELFSISKIKTKKQLMDLQGALPGLEFSDEDDYDEENMLMQKPKKVKFAKDEGIDEFYENIENASGKKGTAEKKEDDEDEGDEPDMDGAMDSDASEHEESNDMEAEGNPLLADLIPGGRKEKKNAATNIWFSKDAFDFLRDDREESKELLKCIEVEEKEARSLESKKLKRKKADAEKTVDEENLEDNNDKEEGEEDEEKKSKNKKLEIVPITKLSAEELALGELITNSKKLKSQILDDSYNRYSTFDEEKDLPVWFVEDEKENWKKSTSVPRNIVGDYKKKFDEINARPIKKVIEAQARKKKRLVKRLDRAKKKAETLSENQDMSTSEKNKEMKTIYRKAGLLAKKKVEVKYIVAKRGAKPGKGVKGPYRVVDKRLKKDKFKSKKNKKANKGGKKGGNKGGNKKENKNSK